MAGLLACGSSRFPPLPGTAWVQKPVVIEGRSPLTVAGAATVSVPNGYASPCSLFIRLPDWSSETIPFTLAASRLDCNGFMVGIFGHSVFQVRKINTVHGEWV